MDYKYIVIVTTIMYDGYTRASYGIAAASVNDGVPIILDLIPDLSLDLNPVEELVNSCNELNLERCHLSDVVEDFLSKWLYNLNTDFSLLRIGKDVSVLKRYRFYTIEQ